MSNVVSWITKVNGRTVVLAPSPVARTVVGANLTRPVSPVHASKNVRVVAPAASTSSPETGVFQTHPVAPVRGFEQFGAGVFTVIVPPEGCATFAPPV